MRAKPVVLVGSILLVAALLGMATPLAASVLAAARTAHRSAAATVLTHAASAPLVANTSCPPSCPNPINSCPPTLQQGSTGTWVQILDYRLNNVNAGGTPLAIGTSFTAATTTAVMDYQHVAGISRDGIVGPQTWSSLGFCAAYNPGKLYTSNQTPNHCPASLSESNTVRTWVVALQDLLNFRFLDFRPFSDITPDRWTPFLVSDGIFGAQTKAAVIDFLAGQGEIGSSGTADGQTWSYLYMCY